MVDYGQVDSMDKWRLNTERSFFSVVQNHAALIFNYALAALCFISPILMVILPSAIGEDVLGLREHQLVCGVECDGLLVGLAFRLFILGVGAWAVFARESRSTLPRVQVYRAVIRILLMLLLGSFWLFYASHLANESEKVRYKGLVGFAQSLTDSLLFVLVLAVMLMIIRPNQNRFYVKVLRSPDGESKAFVCGAMSVQRAASFVLDKYYAEFPLYNPYLERVKSNVTGGASKTFDDGNSTVVSATSKRPNGDRLFEEFEFERKVKKRKAKLIAATDEAFAHIKRVINDEENANESGENKKPMEAAEAARAIFPTLSRPLQKYLRTTRQQPRHSVDAILEHLSTCLSFDMSPRAFLEKFIVTTPVLQVSFQTEIIKDGF